MPLEQPATHFTQTQANPSKGRSRRAELEQDVTGNQSCLRSKRVSSLITLPGTQKEASMSRIKDEWSWWRLVVPKRSKV
ncbi:hypothetical protein BCR33DRAFT_571290 [Rhizoclosmatium globosum]|uniref:Uncharacterized protein n=1 Tax=Rhizoclosmatium globosum TaxID=329046 RepID=A0A1Y2B4X6_9FUNG|nr:hypothetical protein BCR33DRAFT_571290 [Rhizoclosmatium globosum]|eukprot:ORY29883.1 hypothetical protein BCR33DRAFT_571290 [Rhizoclosmatium globosum]